MQEFVPLWAVVIDYVLGVVMWTLIGRFAMGLFLPGFLDPRFWPLYVAWFFYMARFYLMPWLLGYSVMGMLSFPLEGEVARALATILHRFQN
jgi:hypothetical protein